MSLVRAVLCTVRCVSGILVLYCAQLGVRVVF